MIRMTENQKIAKAASTIGTGTLLSRILGFVRDMVIAQFFGAGMAADAFFVAFRIPNLWRRLVGEGSLTISFIPVYTEYLNQPSEDETREVTHIAFTIAGVVLLVLTLLGIFFSPILIRDHSPRIHKDSRKISTDRHAQPDHLSLPFFYGSFCPLHGNSEFSPPFLCTGDCPDLSQYLDHPFRPPFIPVL